ncbi:ArsR/SmtB family transcription factor [Arthrobacter mobilis]|uniref:Metalloregulator ArsR/SmtB family transcription factor n=1 Tax=Arthrobacter mobilis TaxID=2724944 RepID=A0A7X6HCT4_9MICC|nr:metalloregulator ArsR/SmtB family transcription factor [Arthrobacter mobilis]NKX54631.1 metalloregulator ArsR/SmtB family transcription factor [Arthrobacter mobilis]
MGSREAKNALFDAFAAVAKALGSGRRAEIVDILAQGERSVDELAREIGQTVANTSQHLQQLLRAGLVDTRRDGNRIYYSLSGPAVSRLWAAVRQVAAGHAARLEEVAAAYLGDRSGMTVLTRPELSERLQAGDVVVVDVRPDAEFRSGHIAGALSLPVRELEKRLDELPAGRTVVAYCRGPFCVFADDAVRTLQRYGIPAARLEEGYPEWAAAGLPVEVHRPGAVPG